MNKILSNRALIGEYQPFTRRGGGPRRADGAPIPNYFPAIIPVAEFNAVQRRRAQNKALNRGGRTGSAFNLFPNLVKCAYCGGSMNYRNRGALPKGGKYLVCDFGERGVKCRSRNIRYDEVEALVLDNCAQLRPQDILPNESAQRQKREALRIQIDSAEQEISTIEEQSANLVDQVSRTKSPSMRALYESRLEKLESDVNALREQLGRDQIELQRVETDGKRFLVWQQGLRAVKRAIKPKKAVEQRRRLQSHLKEFILRIDVFSERFAEEWSDGGVPERPWLARPEPSWMMQNETVTSDLNKGTNGGKPKRWSREIEVVGQKGLRRMLAASESEFFADCFGSYFDEVIAESGMSFSSRKQLSAFRSDVMKRRLSKEGRFVRVHFRGGRFKDLVPEGSLASGEKLIDQSENISQFTSPDLGVLWEDFKKRNS